MNNNSDNQSVAKSNINWYPGHMAKTKREISEKLNLIDVVFEVIDSRMPLSSKIIDIDSLIKDKPRILIMTKYDLCDKEETSHFIDYYKELGYRVVCVDLINNVGIQNIISESEKIKDSINLTRQAKGLKPRNIRALIIGIPNAGKSTLINRLVGRNSAGVGNKPGFTKQLSWIRINKDIELLDTPGILWPKMSDQEQAHILASFSSIKEEILDSFDLTKFILTKLNELYPEQLEKRYGKLTIDDDMIEAYEEIGRKRGALKRGGICDYDRVANIILNDFRNGTFGPVTFDRLKK